MATLRTLPMAAVLGLVAVAACSLFYTEIDSYPCPPAGTTLRYGSFGASFMDNHCQSCHGSQSIDRRGEYHYIPAVNERPDWIAALGGLVHRHLSGWTLTATKDNFVAVLRDGQRIPVSRSGYERLDMLLNGR